MVKNMPAMQEVQVLSLGWEDPLEKGMATHSRILARRIPRTEQPGGLQSKGLQRIRHDWTSNTSTSLFSSVLLSDEREDHLTTLKHRVIKCGRGMPRTEEVLGHGSFRTQRRNSPGKPGWVSHPLEGRILIVCLGESLWLGEVMMPNQPAS